MSTLCQCGTGNHWHPGNNHRLILRSIQSVYFSLNHMLAFCPQFTLNNSLEVEC